MRSSTYKGKGACGNEYIDFVDDLSPDMVANLRLIYLGQLLQ